MDSDQQAVAKIIARLSRESNKGIIRAILIDVRYNENMQTEKQKLSAMTAICGEKEATDNILANITFKLPATPYIPET